LLAWHQGPLLHHHLLLAGGAQHLARSHELTWRTDLLALRRHAPTELLPWGPRLELHRIRTWLPGRHHPPLELTLR